MLKKIFSLIVLISLLTSSLNITFAQDNSLSSASKTKIRTLKNWQKYILQLNKVDKFIDSQTDSNLLNKLKIKVDSKKDKIIPSILWWDKSNDLSYELLNYISLKLSERIESLSWIEQQKIIDLFNNPELSDNEIKKVNDEIVKLQLNLFNSSKTFVDKLVSNLKNTLNVEEKGNFKFNIEWSWSTFWNARWELNVTNYDSKTSNFDSEFKAQVDLLIDASLKWAPEFKSQFSSFVNFISKDGNFYVLLDKLNYSWINSSEINSYLEKLKELATNNEYLKIEDKNSTYALNLIRNFDLNSIYSETNKVLLNPMFKPYKKEWDKYMLLPTKEACDAIKWIEYKVSWRWKWYCSDSEYNNILKETLKSWSFYIVIDWSEKYIWFDLKNSEASWYVKLYYSDNKIEKVFVWVYPKAEKYKWEYLELNFINWQKLDLVFDAKSESALISFKSLLSSENKFSKINFIGNIEDFTSSFNLVNKKFDWKFEKVLKTYNYDYDKWSWKYDNTWKVNWILNWEVNSENIVTVLNLDINWTESINKYNYDWETWESTSIPTSSIFKLKYTLKNEIISWSISYKEWDKELFSVESTWKYKKEFFELNNKIRLPDLLQAFSDWYSWNDKTTDENMMMNSNLNIKYTWNLMKNTFTVYLDFISNAWIIKAELDSNYEKTQNSNINIETPTKYKNIDEVFPKNNSSNYDNEFFQ